MKKFVVGVVVGIAISMTGTAFAASALIGKKVEGEVKITFDNKTIDSGIIVDGKSYAPVRSITTASGLDLSYKNGTVEIQTKDAVSSEVKTLKNKKADIINKIESAKQRIEKANEYIKKSNDVINDPNSTEHTKLTAQKLVDAYTDAIKEEQSLIEKLEVELNEVEKQLAALEAK